MEKKSLSEEMKLYLLELLARQEGMKIVSIKKVEGAA